jgi:hypothetical protein
MASIYQIFSKYFCFFNFCSFLNFGLALPPPPPPPAVKTGNVTIQMGIFFLTFVIIYFRHKKVAIKHLELEQMV